MCLIIKKPAGRRICPQFLDNAWRHNADGWGSFHLQAGQPVWAKGMDLASLQAHNAGLPEDAEVHLHLRKATCGSVNADMAHPYVVRDGLLLMHNGTLPQLRPAHPGMSDTAELARLLRDLLVGLSATQAQQVVRSEGFALLLAPLIRGSMIVLLDGQGAVSLGRAWHAVTSHEWDHAMHGIEVSNTRTWRPRCTSAPAWFQAWQAARWRLQLWWHRPRAALSR